ncbi:MAG: hypothetical protein PHP29_08045 [Tissierellia bacterium]|nr:hypothetical protein [Tissierellia bacterium]
MNLLKKWFIFILYYVIANLTAGLVVSFLSLIFKVLLITVQGPTVFSRISGIATFYISFSIASFFLFRRYGKKHQQVKSREIILFYSSIILLHFIIIFYGGWETVYAVTTGSLAVVESLYSGTFENAHGKLYSSLRDIPRTYYYMGKSIEDIDFIIFSLIGYLKEKRAYKMI